MRVGELDDDEQAAINASSTRTTSLMESVHIFCGNQAGTEQVCAPLFIRNAPLSNAPACSRLEASSPLAPLRMAFLSLTPPIKWRLKASWGDRAQNHWIYVLGGG